MPRTYRLGKRQAAVDRTAKSILAAARDLVVELGPAAASVNAIARRAGVSRLTVYSRFGSKEGLLAALRPQPPPAEAAGDLRQHLERSCSAWAENPALFRGLRVDDQAPEAARRVAEHLAAADRLRPGCSLKEAEDVIAALSSFPVFDRLHRDGRRAPAAVAEILVRLGSSILAEVF